MRKPKKKSVNFKGNTFIGNLNRGKVAVRVQRSAQGQNLIVGILDPVTKCWNNESRKFPLPAVVKQEFERAFA